MTLNNNNNSNHNDDFQNQKVLAFVEGSDEIFAFSVIKAPLQKSFVAPRPYNSSIETGSGLAGPTFCRTNEREQHLRSVRFNQQRADPLQSFPLLLRAARLRSRNNQYNPAISTKTFSISPSRDLSAREEARDCCSIAPDRSAKRISASRTASGSVSTRTPTARSRTS
jgi:hypothetical protein